MRYLIVTTLGLLMWTTPVTAHQIKSTLHRPGIQLFLSPNGLDVQLRIGTIQRIERGHRQTYRIPAYAPHRYKQPHQQRRIRRHMARPYGQHRRFRHDRRVIFR